jgi:hypothetical protein
MHSPAICCSQPPSALALYKLLGQQTVDVSVPGNIRQCIAWLLCCFTNARTSHKLALRLLLLLLLPWSTGESKGYLYPNQRTATSWYHDHALHITWDNAYHGLAGMYVMSDKVKHGGCGEPYNLEVSGQDNGSDLAVSSMLKDIAIVWRRLSAVVELASLKHWLESGQMQSHSYSYSIWHGKAVQLTRESDAHHEMTP